MRLDKVIIKGFKAYKDETTVHLHPGTNAFVGLNGSGKSSLLEAITLVVSEVYGRRVLDFNAVFHRGQRNSSLSAYVELVFDNTSRRLAMYDRDQVAIRRTFVAGDQKKKDEFSVDNRKITKQEFVSILEAGGFSKANPYYVIRQGKVSEMATMSDEGRLKLLKDFSGVQIYEEKRSEAIKTLQRAEDKVGDADNIVNLLQQRMAELEQEKAELQLYQKNLGQVNLMEAAKTGIELKTNLPILNNLKSLIRAKAEELSRVHDQLHRDEVKSSQSAELGGVPDDLIRTQNNLKLRLGNLEIEERILLKRKIENELSSTTIIAEQDYENRRGRISDILNELNGPLKSANTSLIAELKQSENDLNELINDESTITIRNRSYFEYRKNPQTWKAILEQEAKCILSSISDLKVDRETLIAKKAKLQADANDGPDQDVTEMIHHEQETIRLKEELREIRNEQDALTHEKNFILQNVNSLEMKSNCLRGIRGSMKSNSWAGILVTCRMKFPGVIDDDISLIENLLTTSHQSENRETPILGPLWALIDVPKEYRLAVTETLGAQLENVIVSDDNTATSILPEIKTGSLTLTPLNQVESRHQVVQYPTNLPVDSIPLVSVIQCEPMIKKALNILIGKWIVVPDMDTGVNVSRQTGFNCVTMHGDKISLTGSLKGGYLKPCNDVLTMAEKFRETLNIDSNRKIKETEICLKIQNLQDKATDTLNKIKSQSPPTRPKTKSTDFKDQQIKGIDGDIEKLSKNIAMYQSQVTQLKTTRASPPSPPSIKDEAQLDKLKSQIDEKKSKIEFLKAKISQTTKEMSKLAREKDQLQNDLFTMKQPAKEISIRDESEKLRELNQDKANILVKISAINAEIETFDGEKSSAAMLEILKDQIVKSQMTIQTLKEEISDLENQKRSIDLQVERYNRLAQGANPQDLNKAENLSLSEINASLSRLQKLVQSAPKINQKALESLDLFEEELKKTSCRRSELQETLNSIKSLMNTLDERRSKTLRHSFDQVNTNLQNVNSHRRHQIRSQVFGIIVPGGKAKLVVKKISEDKIQELTRERQLTPPPLSAGGESQDWKLKLSNDLLHWDDIAYGIELKAAFKPNHGEYFPIISLSGGQKTVIALSLIFAMQRCDKAPFYILDEADAALDATYRTSVARLIEETSKDSQFLITSFRKELIEVCDKHFHIQNVDRVAQLSEIPRQKALEIINQEQTAEQTTPWNNRSLCPADFRL